MAATPTSGGPKSSVETKTKNEPVKYAVISTSSKATAKTTQIKGEPVKKVVAKKTTDTNVVLPEHRYHMIATAAYYLAESRGFVAGYEMHDWLAAEKEFDSKINP